MTQMDSKLIEEAHVFLHPTRFRIIEMLTENSIHINAISKALNEERRLVSYHLDTLEQYGFVQSKYEISEQPKSKGKAIRKYWVTDKVAELISEIKRNL